MGIKRKTQPDDSERIRQLTIDYEKVTKEQKERIMALREENQELQKRLQSYEESRHAIAQALLDAERAGRAIIERAKEQAERVTREANEKKRKSEECVQQNTLLLQDLSNRCETILKGIEAELQPAPRSFSLGLVSSK